MPLQGSYKNKVYPHREIAHYVLKIIILQNTKDWEYPYSIAKKLKECKSWHGRPGILSGMKKSDVYNAINSLEKHGYIISKTELKAGRVHKYYKITRGGTSTLKKAKRMRNEMMHTFAEMMGDR